MDKVQAQAAVSFEAARMSGLEHIPAEISRLAGAGGLLSFGLSVMHAGRAPRKYGRVVVCIPSLRQRDGQ
jgi:hypothetical protein